MDKPELVAPAGDWPSLLTAIENGADSVYLGVKGLNMRQQATNFDVLELKKIMDSLHKNKKRGYLALNVIIMNSELDKVEKVLKMAKSADVDAIIAWDMAVISLARKMELKIHLSTQASISNIESLKFFSQLGVQRVVLARECNLNDIKQIICDIKNKHIHCEVETFIHGAMCVSISGRCFISEYSFGKSANRGECRQPCRREFYIKDVDDESEYILGKDYILSPKDLCTIEFIDELIISGIGAFKIEGRMRAPEYVKVVTSVYRKAIDLFFEDKLTKAQKDNFKKELNTVYNRGFSTGFYFGRPDSDFKARLEHTHKKIFLGEVKKFYNKISVAEVLIQNGSLNKGEQILFFGKSTPADFTNVKQMQQEHKNVEKANKGELVGIKIPFVVKRNDKVFIWRAEK